MMGSRLVVPVTPEGRMAALLTNVVFHPRVRVFRDETVRAIVYDFAEITQAMKIMVDLQVNPVSRAVCHRDRFVALRL